MEEKKEEIEELRNHVQQLENRMQKLEGEKKEEPIQEMKSEPKDRDEENISQDKEDIKDKQTTEHGSLILHCIFLIQLFLELKCQIVASPPRVARLYQQIMDV